MVPPTVNTSTRITPSPWRASYSMAWREVVRFLRQRNRVVGAIGQPILFWLLFGTGMNRSFQVSGQRFSEYYVPGTLVLILLFTAIFATISIIEDRQEGFLQAVLVAPVPRWSFVLGKVSGGTLLAVGQSLIFFGLAILTGLRPSFAAGILAVGLMTVTAIGLTGLGFCLAWRLQSTQGFHAIMSLLLMPMWLLSGAFFPVPSLGSEVNPGEYVLHWVMRINPLTYAVAELRNLISSAPLPNNELWTAGTTTCWTVSLCFAVGFFLLATKTARRTTQGDLK